MPKLYELQQNYLNLLEIAEMLDSEQLEEALNANQDDIKTKAEGYAQVIKELDSEVNKFKAEEKRLADKRKAIENNIKKMKESLQDVILLTGNKKFKTEHFSFNIQNNPPSLSVVDEKQIPKQYFIEQSPKLDNATIKQELKNGIEISGVELKQTESLRIK